MVRPLSWSRATSRVALPRAFASSAAAARAAWAQLASPIAETVSWRAAAALSQLSRAQLVAATTLHHLAADRPPSSTIAPSPSVLPSLSPSKMGRLPRYGVARRKHAFDVDSSTPPPPSSSSHFPSLSPATQRATASHSSTLKHEQRAACDACQLQRRVLSTRRERCLRAGI